MPTNSLTISAHGHTNNPNRKQVHARNYAILQRGASTALALTCGNYSHGHGIAMGERLVAALVAHHQSGATLSSHDAGDFLDEHAQANAMTYGLTQHLEDDTAFDLLYLHIEGDRVDVFWSGGIAALLIRANRVVTHTLPHYVGEAHYCSVHTPRQGTYSRFASNMKTRFFGRRHEWTPPFPQLERLGVRWHLQPGDELLVMTDDVWLPSWDDRLPAKLTGNAARDAKQLVDLALAPGARDDISALAATVNLSQPAPGRTHG